MEIYTSVPPPKPWTLKQCGFDCGSTQSLSHSYNVIHSRSLDQLSESVQLCLSVRVQDVKQRPLWLLHETSLRIHHRGLGAKMGAPGVQFFTER